MRLALVVLLALAACATARPSLGDVNLKPYSRSFDSPTTFGVQPGRIISPEIDLAVQDDGCIRGTAARNFVQLCSKAEKAEPSEPGALVQHWAGSGGDFTLEILDHGKKLRADGFLTQRANGALPLQATIPLGQGPQWDELRKNPALLAVAAALAGVRGEPTQ